MIAEAPIETIDLAPTNRIKPFSAELQEELAAYRKNNGFSNKELGRQLGFDQTAVSKYLNGKPEGDVEKFESMVRDVLRAAKLKIAVRHELFDSPVSRQVSGALETIRRTGDVGLIYGDAGLGKTCGIHIFRRATPSAVAVFVTPWNNSQVRMEHAVFDTLETSHWSGNTPRGEFIMEKFVGSNRLIIVDDAHLLTLSALKWFFWMHRQTDCPLALVANKELLEVIRKSGQMFSCVGLRAEVTAGTTEHIRETTRAMLQLHAPAEAAVLEDLAVQVVEHDGHCRALLKQLKLAWELRSKTAKLADPRDAFLAAHGKLVRSYKLEVQG